MMEVLIPSQTGKHSKETKPASSCAGILGVGIYA